MQSVIGLLVVTLKELKEENDKITDENFRLLSDNLQLRQELIHLEAKIDKLKKVIKHKQRK